MLCPLHHRNKFNLKAPSRLVTKVMEFCSHDRLWNLRAKKNRNQLQNILLHDFPAQPMRSLQLRKQFRFTRFNPWQLIPAFFRIGFVNIIFFMDNKIISLKFSTGQVMIDALVNFVPQPLVNKNQPITWTLKTWI